MSNRYSTETLDCAGAPCTRYEQNDPDQEIWNVITYARDGLSADIQFCDTEGRWHMHHLIAECSSKELALAACKLFCISFNSEAWIEYKQIWGDDEEAETICHLTYDEDTGQVVDA